MHRLQQAGQHPLSYSADLWLACVHDCGRSMSCLTGEHRPCCSGQRLIRPRLGRQLLQPRPAWMPYELHLMVVQVGTLSGLLSGCSVRLQHG